MLTANDTAIATAALEGRLWCVISRPLVGWCDASLVSQCVCTRLWMTIPYRFMSKILNYSFNSASSYLIVNMAASSARRKTSKASKHN